MSFTKLVGPYTVKIFVLLCNETYDEFAQKEQSEADLEKLQLMNSNDAQIKLGKKDLKGKRTVKVRIREVHDEEPHQVGEERTREGNGVQT